MDRKITWVHQDVAGSDRAFGYWHPQLEGKEDTDPEVAEDIGRLGRFAHVADFEIGELQAVEGEVDDDLVVDNVDDGVLDRRQDIGAVVNAQAVEDRLQAVDSGGRCPVQVIGDRLVQAAIDQRCHVERFRQADVAEVDDVLLQLVLSQQCRAEIVADRREPVEDAVRGERTDAIGERSRLQGDVIVVVVAVGVGGGDAEGVQCLDEQRIGSGGAAVTVVVADVNDFPFARFDSVVERLDLVEHGLFLGPERGEQRRCVTGAGGVVLGEQGAFVNVDVDVPAGLMPRPGVGAVGILVEGGDETVTDDIGVLDDADRLEHLCGPACRPEFIVDED